MSYLKILIIEDEFIIAANLKAMLQEMGYYVYDPAGTKAAAMQRIKDEEIDFAILDINLKGKHDGIEIGKHLHEMNIPFIYLTSNADKGTIDLAKQTNPKSYLIKPFTKEDIYATLEVAMGNMSHTDKAPTFDEDPTPILTESIFIKSGNKYLKVKISDITHFEADGKTILLYTEQNQRLQVRISLENLLNQLKDFGFIRVHRGFCINSNHLSAINSENVYIGSETIPIGRIFKEELLKRVKTLS